ncbi:DUF6708 domain-containing protein [Andreprevotia chitinilytica]|uniref:DUF6708 domain-containing protein n=1 Tax=Andreprevotia chitinilytica TaxID=396808 RepID=UPI0005527FBE|nr:DUF6708 domain-containing protein [Andreprevotia chitinilytica]
MDYTGLLIKYRINRPLSDEERQNALPKELPATSETPGIDGVLHLSDSYLEIVDKFYRYKGFATPFILAFIVICGGAIVLSTKAVFFSKVFLIDIPAIVFILLGIVAPLGGIGWLIWVLGKEFFTYIHFPIILNRQNRMVYVFRHNGPDGVLAVPWDKLFFCIGKAYGRGRGEKYFLSVRAHVVDDNGIVRDTFDLGTSAYEEEIIRVKWEYFRLYMEQGIKSVPAPPCIVHGRETLRESIATVSSWFGILLIAVIFLPVFILQVFLRYLGLWTCKTPMWPADVKAACQL